MKNREFNEYEKIFRRISCFIWFFRRVFRMPTDNNMNVAKTPIFQRFYEKCSLAVHTVQLRSPFPKII
nr:MAG TPA: hypothetical protein [Caudoviricetes sp.]